jgi:hypothetical protein
MTGCKTRRQMQSFIASDPGTWKTLIGEATIVVE